MPGPSERPSSPARGTLPASRRLLTARPRESPGSPAGAVPSLAGLATVVALSGLAGSVALAGCSGTDQVPAPTKPTAAQELATLKAAVDRVASLRLQLTSRDVPAD